MEAILLPHAAMVVSKQHCVTETLPISIKYIDRKCSTLKDQVRPLIPHSATDAGQAQACQRVCQCGHSKSGYRARGAQGAKEDETSFCGGQGWPQPKCVLVTVVINTPLGKRHFVYPETIQRGGFTSFSQPTRLITCANHGNNAPCASQSCLTWAPAASRYRASKSPTALAL